ncbi:hypothetical protein AB835_13930 [Candidatus Endobugula sertula]|uniref:Rad50/SbcC-type AAA domain-containing protein n=1 Tax=Candidatus Endobugula sertula TaxID=62101 RepID=A0A1D2QLN3_9GAMM|nr:hypothetical protein AB835_13930 [Candidatus Endobugula sertula]
MIIKKLEVKGEGKSSAIVNFNSGLNVIAGASDTGKSYITQCFQFIFGTDIPPKPIEQAKGYSHLEVTFEKDDGTRFILNRELTEKSNITCIEVDNDGEKTILKPSHSGVSNLSNFFLEQINLEGKTLAKGLESMNHSSLTLRILERIMLVDESRIISENSPLGEGQYIGKTLETSLLKTLLTGSDDGEILNSKKDKVSKDSLKKKLENLSDFLDRFFPYPEDDSNSLDHLDSVLESIEASYDKAESELNDLISANALIVDERDRLVSKANIIGRKVSDDKALINRFNMLEKKYLSDRERLEANSEAASYIEQQKMANCPLCGSEFNDDENIDVELIVKSNNSEIIKIDALITDLQSTVLGLTKTLESNQEKLAKLMSDIELKDEMLGESIGKKVEENRNLLRDLDLSRSTFRKERDKELKRQEIYAEIGKLQKEYDEIPDKYVMADFSKEASELGIKISEILKRWGFPNGEDAIFDVDARDVVVAGKPRSHFGKGYRAICFSAIIIGLMEYLFPIGRHLGFVILDSPLTTYRKQDEGENPNDNEEVFLTNNMIYAFYRDLCDYYSDKQVIVLDNQEPDTDLHSLMNYIHFSHNESVGRYGFFPIA